MGQRKLDCYEAHWLSMAANAIRSLVHGCNCQHSWDKQFADLLAVADHGTTDGKPWTEPQPEIGEGYRVATEADASRRDRDMCDVHGRWIPAHVGIYATNCTYRVPIDPPAPQYRPFANAAEFMPHADRWLKEKLQEDFRATVCAFNDKGFWMSGAMVSTTYADGFCIFEFADGTPFGVLINS
jgi:hypothetical protein